MKQRVCPWWMGRLLLNPFRRMLSDPNKLLSPFVRPGMTVLEPGPGLGFFTLDIARLVGETGRVVTIDIQPEMVAGLKRRVEASPFTDRIEVRLGEVDEAFSEAFAARFDLIFASAVIHEIPDARSFFQYAVRILKPGAQFVMIEPSMHVSEKAFMDTFHTASDAGMAFMEMLKLRMARGMVLTNAPCLEPADSGR